MKVLNYGSLNIDHVYDVEDFPKPGETIDSINYKTFLGGKGLNQSIALQRCGVQVHHAGLIGEDGIFLKEELERNGVDTTLIDISQTRTGHALVQVNREGENCIILYHGANKSIQKKDIDNVLANYGTNDYIILQNEISNIDYILESSHKKGLKIVFNPAPFTKSIQSLPLHYVSYLILNESEAKGLAQCAEIEQAMKHLKNTYPDTRFVITLGADGCYFFENDKTIYQKAFDVPVVDTTAAGDTFIGYFIGSIIKSCSVEESLEIASKASALTIMEKGASNAIPTIEAVLRENYK